MTTIYFGVGGELGYNILKTIKYIGIAATFEIGAAYAHTKQCVASKSNTFFGTIKGYTTWCMTWCAENLQLMIAKTNNFVIIKIVSWLRIRPF